MKQLAHSYHTRCYDVFFVPVFSRLGEMISGKPFHPLLHPPTPGERQKLITFPITAEKSHLLIFSSPPLGVSVGNKGSMAK